MRGCRRALLPTGTLGSRRKERTFVCGLSTARANGGRIAINEYSSSRESAAGSGITLSVTVNIWRTACIGYDCLLLRGRNRRHDPLLPLSRFRIMQRPFWRELPFIALMCIACGADCTPSRAQIAGKVCVCAQQDRPALRYEVQPHPLCQSREARCSERQRSLNE